MLMLGTIVCAVALVAALAVFAREDTRIEAAPETVAATTGATAPATTEETVPPPTTATATGAEPPPTAGVAGTTATVAETSASAAPRFVLTAARGACWLDVRRGSASGDRLFVGILRRGRSLELTEPRLWVQAGASEQLAIRLDGRPVRETLAGATTFTLTRSGLEPA